MSVLIKISRVQQTYRTSNSILRRIDWWYNKSKSRNSIYRQDESGKPHIGELGNQNNTNKTKPAKLNGKSRAGQLFCSRN